MYGRTRLSGVSEAGTDGPRPRRSYRGVSPEQRDADRKARAVDAAMQLCADRRTADVSVATVCREAQITTRQFYEIFRDRDELFHAAYEHSVDVARRHVTEALTTVPRRVAPRVRAMLERLFFADETSELGRALAVLFVGGAVSADLRRKRVVSIATAARALAAALPAPEIASGIFMATCVELLELQWLGEPVGPTSETVDLLVRIFAPRLASRTG